MTDAKVNYNFEESPLGSNQLLVKNEEGRTVEHLELILASKAFGEVLEFDGIVDDAYGMINIDDKREIRTTQIDTADTFVVGAAVYFDPGAASAAGKLVDTSGSGNVAVGTITYVDAGVAIGFRPYVQNMSATGLVVT